MLAVGFLIMWGGYSMSLWGWCLLRGYDVTLGQLMSPTHPYGSGKGQSWPPPKIGSDVIFPGGRSGGGQAGTGQVSQVGAFNTAAANAVNAAKAAGKVYGQPTVQGGGLGGHT